MTSWETLSCCLNKFKKIVVKHFHKSLRLNTSRRRRLRESVRRKRPQFWQNDDWYLLHDNRLAHQYQLGRRFVASDKINRTWQEALREVAKHGFQKLYEPWQKRIIAQRDYLEGGCALVL
ncbi:hypothetical protein TNCV_190421 [Trichonephila clavipes]|nr:hypothetical protein TNCV_190421 [Trichonephila clavipes]